MAREFSISEVWPGVHVGSALLPKPEAFVGYHQLQHIFIASQSAWEQSRWATVKGANLLAFPDSPFGLTTARTVQILRAVAGAGPQARVAFLCYAGQNRSAYMAALYRWWVTPDPKMPASSRTSGTPGLATRCAPSAIPPSTTSSSGSTA
jgi:hypothetical protein